MTEPIAKSEPKKQTGPRWAELENQTIDELQKDPANSELYKIDNVVIYYPPVDGALDPLCSAHFNLLDGVARKQVKAAKGSLAIGTVQVDGVKSIIYFAAPSGKEANLTMRNGIIAETNNLIATLGGNKFVPQKLG